MPKMNLNEITRLSVRDVWTDEPRDFTPWLAGNLDLLGRELGMDLELMETEASVGSFSLDILARDSRARVTVVIENQLAKTDHSHLGQLLTYAAGRDAETVIWITDEFRDEHRQALDWLNQRTNDATRFFGVEMEVFKIEESPPAPHFKVVASPNNWSKQNSRVSDPQLSPKTLKYRTFFQALIDDLRENHQFTNAKIGQPESYYFFASGHSSISYGASFVREKQVTVQLYLDKDKERNKRLYDQLESLKSEFESELGTSLTWERLDEAKASRIALYRAGSIEVDDAKLAETKSWMTTHLLKFKQVFGPRLAELV